MLRYNTSLSISIEELYQNLEIHRRFLCSRAMFMPYYLFYLNSLNAGNVIIIKPKIFLLSIIVSESRVDIDKISKLTF